MSKLYKFNVMKHKYQLHSLVTASQKRVIKNKKYGIRK